MTRAVITTCLAALTFWVLLSYATLVATFLDGRIFVSKDGNNIRVGDFVPFYMGALLARDSLKEKFNIYDPDVQLKYTRAITAPVQPEKPRILQSPPYLLGMLLPLAAFDLHGAWIIWTVAALIAAAISIWRLSAIAFDDRASRLLMVAAFFSFYPTWLAVGQGQTAPFIFAALLFFFDRLSRKAYVQSGLSTAIISIKLQFLPIPVLIGCILGRLRFVKGGAIAAAALLLLSVLVVGVTNVINYPHSLFSAETDTRFEGVSPVTMQNIRGFLSVLAGGDPQWVHLVSAAFMLLGLFLIAVLWSRQQSKLKQSSLGQDRMFDLLVAVTIPVMLITSVHAHVYDYLYMSIPWALLWRHRDTLTPGARHFVFWSAIAFVPLSWLCSIFHDFLLHIDVQPYVWWSGVLGVIAYRAVRRECKPQ